MVSVWGKDEDVKPQVRAGWGTGSGQTATGVSHIGVVKKTAAENYWESKTTEIFIPEMGDDGTVEVSDNIVSEAPTMDHKMTNLHELNKDFALNVPSVTPDGTDISLLTSVIRPIADLIETDMQWDYLGLQAEIG